MPESRPLISVVIPVYDGENYLAQAIESVLAQHYSPLELFVVDDGSTDNSALIAQSFSEVRYIYQSNQGIAGARNTGINAARGEFIAFLDADDLWEEYKLARQLAAFDADPDLDAVFGRAQQFISPELDESVASKLLCPTQLMAGYLPSAMLVKRSVFDRVGLFETGWQVGEFINWYLRATERGLRVRMLPDLILKRRIHRTNQGIRQRSALTDYARIIKLALDRRRDGGTVER